MIVVFAAQKGGVGKSTTATNLAVQRTIKGRRVIIVDLDQGQNSAIRWANRRTLAKIEPAIKVVALGVAEVIPHIQQYLTEYDDILVDTGGADSSELRLALQLADLVITPIRAAAVEAETLDLIDRRVTEAKIKNPDLAAWILLNDLTTHHLIRDKAQAKLREYCQYLTNLQLMDSTVDHRQALIDANDAGAAVIEMEQTKSVRAAVEDQLRVEKEIWND